MFEPYFLLVTLHVVLFAYWLGGDYGVFICSRYIARPNLSLEERQRFLEALLAIDILPRTAIVLLPFVGLQMAFLRGSAFISVPALIACWVIAVSWLIVVWMAYKTRFNPKGVIWQKIDVSWRMVLIIALIAFGISTLFNNWPIKESWIGLKLIIYALLLILGLYLRLTIADWKKGFISLRQGITGPDIDALFINARRRAKYAAFAFWLLVATMGWIGISQPSF